MNKKSKLLLAVFVITAISIYINIAQSTPTPTSTISANTPTPKPPEISFEVTFDEDENCIIAGPSKVPTGNYLFSLDLLQKSIDLKVIE